MTTNVPESGAMGTGFPGRQADWEEQGLPLQAGGESRIKNPRHCPHGKFKAQCRECGGSAFCIHRKRKAECRECSIQNFCEHDRLRHKCKDCKGASISQHGVNKHSISFIINTMYPKGVAPTGK